MRVHGLFSNWLPLQILITNTAIYTTSKHLILSKIVGRCNHMLQIHFQVVSKWKNYMILSYKHLELHNYIWSRMIRNDQFHPIHNFSNLFPPKWLRMTQNSQFCQIHNFSNLFPPKWLRMTWNGQFHPICKFSNLFPPKWLRMTQNSQFHLIWNFSNLFPPKWLRMTQNGQFRLICNFSNLF